MSKNNANKKNPKSEIAKKVGEKGGIVEGVHQDKSLTSKAEIIEIEEQLEEINPGIFEGVDEIKKKEILGAFRRVTTLSVTERHHSGPLPPADLMIQYNSVIPNGGDRIMIMGEKEQDHRIYIERSRDETHKKAVNHMLGESSRGQIFGFIIAIFFGSISAFLGYEGHDWLAGGLGGATLVSLVATFVLGRKRNNTSKNNKEDEDEEDDE